MSLIKKLAEKALATLSQRGQENGYDKKPGTAQEERSAAQIARVFNELTGHQLSTTDAWTFLQVLKLVRMENQIKTGSGDLLDSCNDMISYSLLKAETALEEYRPGQCAELNREKPFIKVGDKVKLNSGGPCMSVTHKTMLGDLLCTWINSKGRAEEAYFAPDMVMLVTGKTSADYGLPEVGQIATGNHHKLIPEIDLPDDKHSAIDD